MLLHIAMLETNPLGADQLEDSPQQNLDPPRTIPTCDSPALIKRDRPLRVIGRKQEMNYSWHLILHKFFLQVC